MEDPPLVVGPASLGLIEGLGLGLGRLPKSIDTMVDVGLHGLRHLPRVAIVVGCLHHLEAFPLALA